jgi:hypothetical protein
VPTAKLGDRRVIGSLADANNAAAGLSRSSEESNA